MAALLQAQVSTAGSEPRRDVAGVSTAAQRALLSGQRCGAPAAARRASSAPARASAAAQRRSRSSACAARSSRASSRPRARLAASPARPAAASRASSCGGAGWVVPS